MVDKYNPYTKSYKNEKEFDNWTKKCDEWLKQPIVQKHLKHFMWSKRINSVALDVHYQFMDYATICEVIGCLEMGGDPEYELYVSDMSIERVRKIHELPQEERQVITDLFKYFNEDCPRKRMKKIIPEYKIDYNNIL